METNDTLYNVFTRAWWKEAETPGWPLICVVNGLLLSGIQLLSVEIPN